MWTNKTLKGWYRLYTSNELFKIITEYKYISKTINGNLKSHRKYIPKKNGKLRPLGVPSKAWRIYNSAWAEFLQRLLYEKISINQHGFMKGRNAVTAWQEIIRNYRKGYKFFFEADLTSFFNKIEAEAYIDSLRAERIPETLISYLDRVNKSFPLIRNMEAGEGELTEGYFGKEKVLYRQGFPQGLSWSPILANMTTSWYFKKLNQNIKQVWFADDMIFMAKTLEELNEVVNLFNDPETSSYGIIPSMKIKKLKNGREQPATGDTPIFEFLGILWNRGQIYNEGKWIPWNRMNPLLIRKLAYNEYSDKPKTHTGNPVNKGSLITHVEYKHTFWKEILKIRHKFRQEWNLPLNTSQFENKIFDLTTFSSEANEWLLQRNQMTKWFRSGESARIEDKYNLETSKLYNHQEMEPIGKKITTVNKFVNKELEERQRFMTNYFKKWKWVWTNFRRKPDPELLEIMEPYKTEFLNSGGKEEDFLEYFVNKLQEETNYLEEPGNTSEEFYEVWNRG